MNKTTPIIVALALAVAACSQSSPTSDPPSSTGRPAAQVAGPSEVTGVPYAKLVGQWQFVYDDNRRAIYEAQLAAKISDPSELAKAKRDAEDEAAVSVIEFTKDGFYVSYIDNKEIFRGAVDKAPPGLTLTLRDDRTLVMHDPTKGDLIFTRR